MFFQDQINQEQMPSNKIVELDLQKLGLSEEDMPAVKALSQNIDGTVQGLQRYGASIEAHDRGYIDNILKKADADDLGAIGDRLSEIAVIAKSVNLSGLGGSRSNLPIIGKFFDKVRLKTENFKMQFENANQQISSIINEVAIMQGSLLARNQELELLFASVVDEHRQMGLQIAAGTLKLNEAREALSQKQAELAQQQHPNPILAQEISDLGLAIASMDKRLGDLEVMQISAQQTMPAIRIIQTNNRMLMDKFNTIKEITIPSWKNQFMLALTLQEQESHLKVAKAIDDATNDLLKSNAELLHKNAVGASVASQRLAIDPETLKHVQKKLIDTVNDVVKSQIEGEQKRKAALEELRQISETQFRAISHIKR